MPAVITMLTLSRRLLLASALVVAVAPVLACTAGQVTEMPVGDGTVASGGGGGQTAPTSSTGSPAPSSPPPAAGGGDGAGSGAGSGGATGSGGSAQDAGGAIPNDAGAVVDAHPPTPPTMDASPVPPPSVTCGTPACATDGNECGCTTAAPNGQTAQMGCQAGGQCICLLNNQPVGQPFDENGACNDQASAQQQFLQYCSCP